jgi:hypothetical protein
MPRDPLLAWTSRVLRGLAADEPPRAPGATPAAARSSRGPATAPDRRSAGASADAGAGMPLLDYLFWNDE